MQSKVLLLGATGLLGNSFARSLASSSFELMAPGRSELDLLRPSELAGYLEAHKPQVVINCAGFNEVDAAELAPPECWQLNADLPEILANYSKDSGSKLVQFSTDYVFDGEQEAGYSEDAERNPINKYAQAKLAGEKAVMANDDAYLIRISWLFGSGKKNFVTTMLDLAARMPELKVVNDQHGKPTYTEDVVAAVLQMLAEDTEPGIYHLPNEETTTWYDFAREIFEQAGQSIEVRPVPASEFPRPAPRPQYSALLNTKRPLLRSWREALKDYLNQIN